MRTILIPLLYVCFASAALASEGVLEINQVCAEQSGCFAGDTPGFPVTLTAGSHLLTSDLIPPPDTRAIDGVASNVRLDLAGFSIIGSTVGGSASGVSFQGSHWEIRGGTVRGFSGTGISQANAGDKGVSIVDMRLHDNGCKIDGVTTSMHTTHGMSVGDGATISNVSAFSNGGVGVICGDGCIVTKIVAHSNTTAALLVGTNSGYSECILTGTTTVGSSGTPLGNRLNLCNGSVICP